jgi:type IV pilus assembly protein PilE
MFSSIQARTKGFTLIELMITVAIIGILAGIAYPSYQQYMQRSSRSAAQSQMMDIANRQQQYFLANRAYATKSELEAGGYALPSDVSKKYTYNIVLSDGPPPSYVINFVAIGNQASDGNLSLSSEGVKTPADKW